MTSWFDAFGVFIVGRNHFTQTADLPKAKTCHQYERTDERAEKKHANDSSQYKRPKDTETPKITFWQRLYG
jgi:hypothetical protein